ncbi:nicotinamide n-methyltransferase [Grosmannia clavigera kw1407]|uniref:Nicotinamide n-methyltransferase n=1 Tax=Grosmannia clavigera (strain kw1407 / UAMH 11150) TaxID=655863 RepID=F0XC72_GROCL|nr:nicotinamide n-methyltransferase [Grosmannia clavigera kw1407]EFX04502.1 nicotinamide n-methyltransferase [Grosmannia clavigera kw1407]
MAPPLEEVADIVGSGGAVSDDDGSDVDIFADPPGFYPPTPPPTTEKHALGRSGVQLTLHLVGHSALEAHRLWNGSRVLSDYLEEQQEQQELQQQQQLQEQQDPKENRLRETPIIRGRTVLELGAGAALPGIVCGLVLGARRVVVTDYPDPDLVATMRKNIAEAEAGLSAQPATQTTGQTAYAGSGTIVADGYVWGADPTPILAHLNDLGNPDGSSTRYDVMLLADLLFRHAEHSKMAYSVAQMLAQKPDSRAYVFFTSYRPWLRHKDLAFFADACAAGLVVEHLLERRLERPPLFFKDDPGDVDVRSTVSGYSLRWPQPGEDPAAFWPPAGGADGAAETQTDRPAQDRSA